MKATEPPIPRSRALLAACMLLLVVLGLGSRASGARQVLPRFVTDYAGDTLWATLVYLGVLWLWPRLSVGRAAAAALGFSVLIEFSQLFHPPWLDALRANPYVALVLGRGFLASDLVCYTAGVVLGGALDAGGLRLADRLRSRRRALHGSTGSSPPRRS